MLLSDVRTDVDAAITHTLDTLAGARAAARAAAHAHAGYMLKTATSQFSTTVATNKIAARVANVAEDYHTDHVRILEEMLRELMVIRAEIGRTI